MYAVVIERSGSDPRVVVFNHYDGAFEFQKALEKSTEGRWDDDPDWHNYPRPPIRVMQPYEAEEMVRLDVAEDKKSEETT